MAGVPPTITSHRAALLRKSSAREILDSLRLTLPTVAPGQNPEALRFVSLALHILPQKGGRHRRYVSARNVSEPYCHPETHFSSYFSSTASPAHTIAQKNPQHTASLDELAEPI
jgi:hypothetical protein